MFCLRNLPKFENHALFELAGENFINEAIAILRKEKGPDRKCLSEHGLEMKNRENGGSLSPPGPQSRNKPARTA